MCQAYLKSRDYHNVFVMCNGSKLASPYILEVGRRETKTVQPTTLLETRNCCCETRPWTQYPIVNKCVKQRTLVTLLSITFAPITSKELVLATNLSWCRPFRSPNYTPSTLLSPLIPCNYIVRCKCPFLAVVRTKDKVRFVVCCAYAIQNKRQHWLGLHFSVPFTTSLSVLDGIASLMQR